MTKITKNTPPTLTAIPGDRAQLEREQAKKLIHALLVEEDFDKAKAITKVLEPRGVLAVVAKDD